MGTNDEEMSAIDRAINEAKNKKARRTGEAVTPEQEEAPKRTRARLSAEERVERDAQRQQEKDARGAARAAKRAAREAASSPAHMKKIAKAEKNLPVLSPVEVSFFNSITESVATEAITALALHLQHFVRLEATKRALETKLEAGNEVVITGGDPKFVGMRGRIAKAQRIRCYVEVDGLEKHVYCFTSDVSPVNAVSNDIKPESQTGTES